MVTKGESSSRYADSTKARNGKKKRAQVQQVDEFTMQKLRENHETIQQLTFQLQQIQEQMNAMNSCGEFQDIESNCRGILSHVSNQLVMIPSSRAFLSRDKRLPLDTWKQSGVQENVLENPFTKEFHRTTCKEIEKQPLEI